MLERGEWVVNRERISPENLRRLADSFHRMLLMQMPFVI